MKNKKCVKNERDVIHNPSDVIPVKTGISVIKRVLKGFLTIFLSEIPFSKGMTSNDKFQKVVTPIKVYISFHGLAFERIAKLDQKSHATMSVIHNPSDVIHNPSDVIHNPSDVIHNPPNVIRNSPDVIHNPSDVIHNPSDVIHNPPNVIRNSPDVIPVKTGISFLKHLLKQFLTLFWYTPPFSKGRIASNKIHTLKLRIT